MAFPDKIAKLHSNLMAARDGYLEAAKDSGVPGVSEFFDGVALFHEKNAQDLKAASGVDLSDDALLMSTVHRVVVRVRSAIVTLDATQLEPFITGEEQIVSEYDEALEESRETARLATLLMGQRRGLLAKIEAMKAMKAAA